MMRVTDKLVFDAAGARTMNARSRVDEAVSQVSTGRRMQHPADDPAAAGFVSAARLNIKRFEAIREGVQRAGDELTVAERALEDLKNVILRARELAMQLGNGSYTAADRANGAPEIDAMINQAIGIMNTQMGDRYVFGGYQDGAPPFDQSGNYVGDTGVRQIEIAPGVVENASVRADEAVKGIGGGLDLFQVLSDLGNALRTNDHTGITTSLEQLDTSMRQVSRAQTAAASSLTVFQAADEAALTARDQTVAQLSRASDTDIVEAASRLALANHALEASLSATAKSFSLSLLNRLP